MTYRHDFCPPRPKKTHQQNILLMVQKSCEPVQLGILPHYLQGFKHPFGGWDLIQRRSAGDDWRDVRMS